MEITLNELIEQVREELSTPLPSREKEELPFLFVDEIEIEVGVTISKTTEGSGDIGAKVTIGVAEIEGKLGGGVSKADQSNHRIKIKMTPLFSKEDLLSKFNQDFQGKLRHQAMGSLMKGDGMVGEE